MSTQHEDTNLDNIMRKVQGLIAKADSTEFPAEAEAFRAKADALMFKYKIEALTAQETPTLSRPVPQWTTFWVSRRGSEWVHYYSGIAKAAMDAADVRYYRYSMSQANPDDDGHSWLTFEAVGYESDLRYAQVLMTEAIAAFGRHLEPKHDPAETPAANALRLRRGGMERRRISLALFGGYSTENEMKAQNRKVTNLIKAEATRIGQPQLVSYLLGRSSSIKTYRESYSGEFYWTLLSRLRQKKWDDAMHEQAMVLASAANAVEEALYERHPEMRPKAVIDNSSFNTQDKCEKCAKTKSGYCREHQWLKPTKGKDRPYSSAGAWAGRSAARSVDLGGGHSSNALS